MLAEYTPPDDVFGVRAMTDWTPAEAWLITAQDMLERLDRSDPMFAAGWTIWVEKLREYDGWKPAVEEAVRAAA